jgi:hypothetical protein
VTKQICASEVDGSIDNFHWAEEGDSNNEFSPELFWTVNLHAQQIFGIVRPPKSQTHLAQLPLL